MCKNFNPEIPLLKFRYFQKLQQIHLYFTKICNNFRAQILIPKNRKLNFKIIISKDTFTSMYIF